MHKTFEIIVVGAGHAGVEAALAAARMGHTTALVTKSDSDIGQLSCNPSIGGIGKSHLVREVDALGGAMALAAEKSAIQMRVLNARKGPAVRAVRAQVDRVLYRAAMMDIVKSTNNLTIVTAEVTDLVVKANRVSGVITNCGTINAKAVILASGTFLGGKLFIGDQQMTGGRFGEPAAIKLADRLRQLPLKVGRLKTGTPPRLDKKSLNYKLMSEQWGDTPQPLMSFVGSTADHPEQICCYLTKTTEQTHDIIRQYLHQSPLFKGDIEGVGPRYCPSIEDKVVRFSDRTSHQVFVEPEGLSSDLIYPNGISTSLPKQAQQQFIQSVIGFEQAKIMQWGYAIEYDYIEPQGLQQNLQSKWIDGLFLAGQINGTTGYEEAAAQGIYAGINAALQIQNQPPLVLGRDQAYIGVMIDDLITLGTTEPYRMFTSRAEYRLFLRQDNADQRLTDIANKLQLIDAKRLQVFRNKYQQIASEQQRLTKAIMQPASTQAKTIQKEAGIVLNREYSQYELLKRPEMSHALLAKVSGITMASDISESVEIAVKYSGYIKRQQQEVASLKKQEHTPIPLDFNYTDLPGLSNEAIDKLLAVKPQTLGQAGRISGVTPSTIALLAIYLKKAS